MMRHATHLFPSPKHIVGTSNHRLTPRLTRLTVLARAGNVPRGAGGVPPFAIVSQGGKTPRRIREPKQSGETPRSLPRQQRGLSKPYSAGHLPSHSARESCLSRAPARGETGAPWPGSRGRQEGVHRPEAGLHMEPQGCGREMASSAVSGTKMFLVRAYAHTRVR